MFKEVILNLLKPCMDPMHRGPTLSLYLFALIMDELTAHIQEEISWCMLFANDIVLVDGNGIREVVNAKLER